MSTPSEALAIAMAHHQGGRLRAAEEIYRQILRADPRHADAMHLIGVIALQTGNPAAAVECIERAIGWDGNRAIFHSNLGEAYRSLRRLPEAIACFRRALELAPDLAGVYYNLGNALKDDGRLEQAIEAYRQAIRRKPDYPEAHNNLGNALKDRGRTAEAIACYQRALELKGDFVEAHNNLGNALKDQGHALEAIGCFQRALELKPAHAEAQCNLGNALAELGRPAEAIACYRRALELKPDFAEAHYNLGFAFQDQGRFSEAIRQYQRALELKPGYAEAQNNLGVAFKDQGQIDEALAGYRRALELEPGHATAHSNLVFTLQYKSGVTLEELAAAHREYDRRHAAPLRNSWPTHDNNRDPDRRLRLGFLSPDFRRHPVGYFLIRAFENLDRRQCEPVCYYDRRVRDEWTSRFQAAAAEWHDVAGQGDGALAERIRGDRIDILFDLAGHTAHNRLLVFARKPAPIQITWIGYEGTTGLAAMDYLLADRYMVAEGAERYFREKVLRMPHCYLCYDPPAAAPPIGPLPMSEKGHATFGSFNNLAKITPEVVAVWAKVLKRLPQSRLVIQYKGLGDPTVQRRYLDLFAACGVQSERLDLLPPASFSEYLAGYNRIDLALDPFPQDTIPQADLPEYMKKIEKQYWGK